MRDIERERERQGCQGRLLLTSLVNMARNPPYPPKKWARCQHIYCIAHSAQTQRSFYEFTSGNPEARPRPCAGETGVSLPPPPHTHTTHEKRIFSASDSTKKIEVEMRGGGGRVGVGKKRPFLSLSLSPFPHLLLKAIREKEKEKKSFFFSFPSQDFISISSFSLLQKSLLRGPFSLSLSLSPAMREREVKCSAGCPNQIEQSATVK